MARGRARQGVIAGILDFPNHFALVASGVPAFNISKFIFTGRFIQNDVEIFHDVSKRHPAARNRAKQTGEKDD
jgi:hypothetical protein